MLFIATLILPFFALILAGYVAAKIFKVQVHGQQWLNILVIYFALPALIFETVAQTNPKTIVDLSLIFSVTAATFIVFVSTYFIMRVFFRKNGDVAAIQSSAASYGNIGYMGLALSVAAFGPTAAVPAAIIFCTDNILQFIAVPLTVAWARRYETRDKHEKNNANIQFSYKNTLIHIIKPILTHPFIIATTIAILFAFLGIYPGGGIGQFIHILAQGAAPCALFAMGMTLALAKTRLAETSLPIICLMKLIIQPMLVWTLITLIADPDPLWFNVALLMATLPTAANVFVFATQYNVYKEGASTAIMATTLIAAFLFPVLLYALSQQWIQ